MYCLNDITGVCGTFPCRHLILKVLYPVPTLLVGVPPSVTDKGQPELINEGRMLADEKENVRFIFADKENWKRKSGRTMSVCAWSTVEWFQGFLSQLHIVHCNQSSGRSIGMAESHVNYDDM